MGQTDSVSNSVETRSCLYCRAPKDCKTVMRWGRVKNPAICEECATAQGLQWAGDRWEPKK